MNKPQFKEELDIENIPEELAMLAAENNFTQIKRIKGSNVYVAKGENGRTYSIQKLPLRYSAQVEFMNDASNASRRTNIPFYNSYPSNMETDVIGDDIYVVGSLLGDNDLIHEKIVQNDGDLTWDDASAIAHYLYLMITFPEEIYTVENRKDSLNSLSPLLLKMLRTVPKVGNRFPQGFQYTFEKNMATFCASLEALADSPSNLSFRVDLNNLVGKLRRNASVFNFRDAGTTGIQGRPIPTMISYMGEVQGLDISDLSPNYIAFYEVASKLSFFLTWVGGFEAAKKVYLEFLTQLMVNDRVLLGKFRKYFLSVFSQRVAGDIMDNLYQEQSGVLSVKTENSVGSPVIPKKIIWNVDEFLNFLEGSLEA